MRAVIVALSLWLAVSAYASQPNQNAQYGSGSNSRPAQIQQTAQPASLVVAQSKPAQLNECADCKPKASDKKASEGTEYIPTFFGLHLKVTDSLLALFTFLLVIATVYLGFAGEKQLRLTRKAAEVAETTLLVTQRPWIHLKIITATCTKRGNQLEVVLEIEATNTGNSPAMNVVFMAHVPDKPINQAAMPEAIEFVSGITRHQMENSMGAIIREHGSMKEGFTYLSSNQGDVKNGLAYYSIICAATYNYSFGTQQPRHVAVLLFAACPVDSEGNPTASFGIAQAGEYAT